MISDDELLGVQKMDERTLKPLKVRLPLEHVLELHRLRIVGEMSVSEIVETALEDYLKGLQEKKQSPRNEIH